MTYAIIEESGWEAVAKIREQRKSVWRWNGNEEACELYEE
jgi:hypothetical protein